MRAPLILIVAAVLALLLQLNLMQGPPMGPDPAAGADLRVGHGALPGARRPRAGVQGSVPPGPVAAAALRPPYTPSSLRSPFDADRSAGASPIAVGGSASAGFSLTGLVRGAGSASAIVRDPSGAGHVLRPGDSLQGWRLEAVGRDDVALSHGTERRTLTLNGPPAVLNRTSP